jgi:translation initiation factor eIF-2B subunit alpha
MYVAAESYKFARLYPLRQSDLPLGSKQQQQHQSTFHFCDTTATADSGKALPSPPIELDPNIRVQNPSVDFTPSKFITLLFTDLGVLTPSAVSDELIRLYQ